MWIWHSYYLIVATFKILYGEKSTESLGKFYCNTIPPDVVEIFLAKCRIAGNFRGSKLTRMCSFVATRKSFVHEIWRHGILWCSTSEKSAEVFFVKTVFFTNSLKFSPSVV